MKFTNKKNLPEIIVKAVTNDPYDKGKSDFTVTQLLKPAFQNMLQREHADEIVEDISDRLWSLYGQAAHHVIERAAGDVDEVETRYFAEFEGKVISAQIDHRRLIGKDLTDWKLTSAYKVKLALQGDFEDWEEQLNMQAWLLEQNGERVNSLHIGAMVRDWTPFSKKTEDGYPDQVEYIEIPKWHPKQVEGFIAGRIEAQLDPQPCSQKERWQNDPDFAVIKKGGSRAAKVEFTFDAAKTYRDNKGWSEDDYDIVERSKPNRRCEGYCNVTEFCPFYQETYAKAEDLPFKEKS
jgi:hypothetical protein